MYGGKIRKCFFITFKDLLLLGIFMKYDELMAQCETRAGVPFCCFNLSEVYRPLLSWGK